MQTIVVVSDIHYASAGELARKNFESLSIPNPWQRFIAQSFRWLVWMRDPLAHTSQFDRFLEVAGNPDWVVVNGDMSVDSGFIGAADDAVFETIRTCLSCLRERFPGRLLPVMGDHELGKLNLCGGAGGMRLASYTRSTGELAIPRFWTKEVGVYTLMAITSSLAALPVYMPELMPSEQEKWEALRKAHLEEIKDAFCRLKPQSRVVLFSHDPTALAFLAQEEAIRERLNQIDRTIIGHLHSNFTLRTAQFLAGMPHIGFLGNTVRRYTASLREAAKWKPFKLLLCPSITGIQLLKDGGFLRLEVDPEGRNPLRHTIQRLPWKR